MSTANKTILLVTIFIALANGIFSTTIGGGWDYAYDLFVVSPLEREIKAEGVTYLDIFGNHHDVTPEKVELDYLGDGKYSGKVTFTLEGVTYTRTLAAFDAYVANVDTQYNKLWIISTNFNGDVEEFKHSLNNDFKRAKFFYQTRNTAPKYPMELVEINIRESDLQEDSCQIDALFKVIGPNGKTKMEKARLKMSGMQVVEKLMTKKGKLTNHDIKDVKDPIKSLNFDSDTPEPLKYALLPSINWEFESGSRIKYPSPHQQ